ncbi:hypothetical protein CY0110_19152 [Crocosphaera chwakensis CCY0110]|uniref:Uncharacterized protein n=1 Tax=Crocosphaera chwakensis CCY0110 TaxID=391612 RepID=A3IJG2_9CHRO|nr:hypothetical protein CY0110_19152 [Crocosphaera chwakensis CCY0110]
MFIVPTLYYICSIRLAYVETSK